MAPDTALPGDRPLGLDEAVRAGMEEVRYQNGLTLAFIRIGLRVLTLTIWLVAIWRTPTVELRSSWTAIAMNVAHLVVGGWVLVELRARRRVHVVLGVAAAVDVFVVAFAGFNLVPGDAASVAYLMAVMQLMLLFAALTLPRLQAALLGAAATAWQLALGLRVGLRADFLAASVLVAGAFAVAVTWAGTRMMELAARHALDTSTGELVRAHRNELARANLAIAAQRDQVLAAQAEAETLAKLVVHDLKNPLAALLQFLALALTRIEEAAARGRAGPELVEAKEDLQLATLEAQRLSEMVGDLLLISRLETAALEPKRQPIPVLALLEQVAHGASLRAQDRAVTVQLSAEQDMVAALDLDMVRRLLENLLSNALRFVDRGGRVELGARLEEGALVLAVRNTGPTVPEEVRSHLFQKHAHGAERQFHNVGLGLYLCRLVAEAHGGSVALVDTPGWPVAFEARIPVNGRVRSARDPVA